MKKYHDYHTFKHHNDFKVVTKNRVVPSNEYKNECNKILAFCKKIKRLQHFKNNEIRFEKMNLKVLRYSVTVIEFNFLKYHIKMSNDYNHYVVTNVNSRTKLEIHDLKKLNDIFKNNLNLLFDEHKEINNVMDFFQYNEKSVDNENTSCNIDRIYKNLNPKQKNSNIYGTMRRYSMRRYYDPENRNWWLQIFPNN